jgi:spermidine synthase
VVLLGQAEKLKVNLDDIEQRLARAEYKPVADSLHEVGFKSGLDLLSTYAVQASDLRGWLRHAQINRDRNLRLQYLAGMGLNQYLAPVIYEQMLQLSSFPSEIFTGSAERVQSLRTSIAGLRY